MSFIKLDRKITEWEWFTDANTLKLWIYLLVNAQYQDGSYKGIEIKRGQLVTGRKKLAEQLEMSEQQIRTCLDHLQATNEITIKPTNKYSLITIVKYGFYQGEDDGCNQQNNQQSNQRITNKQPTNNHNKRNKEGKEGKEIKNITSLYAPSSAENDAVARIPLNITDTYYLIFQEDIDHYKGLYPAVDVEQEIRSMVGWCEANPNNRKTKNGIKRFINNWLNKSQNRTRAYSERNKSGVNYIDIE